MGGMGGGLGGGSKGGGGEGGGGEGGGGIGGVEGGGARGGGAAGGGGRAYGTCLAMLASSTEVAALGWPRLGSHVSPSRASSNVLVTLSRSPASEAASSRSPPTRAIPRVASTTASTGFLDARAEATATAGMDTLTVSGAVIEYK